MDRSAVEVGGGALGRGSDSAGGLRGQTHRGAKLLRDRPHTPWSPDEEAQRGRKPVLLKEFGNINLSK